MSDPDSDRKSDLECLRLASELIELATSTLNPALKSHCLRMAEAWSDRVGVGPEGDKQSSASQRFLIPEIAEDLLIESPIVVLIVEDEPLLRMLATEVVSEAGYVALEAGDADEALALMEARSDIALLFTDIDMPGSMDGLKLAHAVRYRWPPIKIVIVSGQVHPKPSDLPSNSRFFAKPYGAAALVGELRTLLG